MRYARQVALAEIGVEGQRKLENANVAIVGVGALGTVAAELLVRAGIRGVLLVDDDYVDEINLQRQTLFKEKHIGSKKVNAALKELEEINSKVKITTKEKFISGGDTSFLRNYDLILDCTDNMKARHTINNHCKKTKQMWIHAAGSGVKGNILVVEKPEVFERLFKTAESFDSCEEIGVINTLTNTIASLQVTEAFKVLTGENYCKDLIRFNLWNNKYERFKIR